MKKYLITGGAGFIGSHLVDLLLNMQYQVIVVDDLSFGKLENLPSENIIFINKPAQQLNLLEIEGIDGIFHLAAQASVPLSIENFYESSKNNLESSLKVLDIARQLSIPLVYATSSAVYGNLPLGSDEIAIFDLQSPYALDKLVLEQYASIAYKIYGVSSIGLRFFNVYGPRQDPSNPYSGVISIFANRMLTQQTITVNGGHQTRDFIYVGDIVNTLYKSMVLASEKKCCESINVGTGVSMSINALVEVLSELIQANPKIDYQDLPFGDPEKSEGTYAKLEKILNIKLNELLSLKDGLEKTINYFKASNGI